MKNKAFILSTYKAYFFLALLLISQVVSAATEFPERSNPPRLVNDFTGILSSSQVNALENKLVDFNNRSSTQIAVVLVKDLFGYDKADYAFRLAEKWGIGQKGKNNGILILVKPKFDHQPGQVFIAVGYGLEGVVPDITARQSIVQAEILPNFKKNDYYTGLDRATSVLISLTSGEFTADQYDKKASKSSGLAGFGLILIIFFIIMLFNRNRSHSVDGSGGTGSLLGTLWMMSMFSGRQGGSWNDFSGGSGGFGGDSGGFGGFGGGSFGGGGAGGSW